MAQIAEKAGVSRQTIYNEFGSRNGFLQAYIMNDADRLLNVVGEAMLQGSIEPQDMIERAFLAFIEAVRADPLPIKGSDDKPQGSLLRMLTYGGAPLLAYASTRLSRSTEQVWPSVEADERRIFCEQLVRLSLSHVVLSDERPLNVVAADVAKFLLPIAKALLNQGQKVEAPTDDHESRWRKQNV